MLRLADNPPMTLPEAGPIAEVDAPWTAVYTKPRQEKALAHDLCRHGVPYFLPMIERVTSSGGRRRRNLYPLFPSYLFFAATGDQRLTVLQTERIVSLVAIEPAQQPAFRQEIASLELGLRTAPESLTLYPRLVAGEWVRVVKGPLAGVEGTLLATDHHTRLLLAVTIMGAGATVEIHPDLVEPTTRDPHTIPQSTVEIVYKEERV